MEYYNCHRCGKKTREDNFVLPTLFDSYFVKKHEKKEWDKFIASHSDKIARLGIEHGNYGIQFEPVCPKCCDEIINSHEYAELKEEWEKVKKNSLGGKERESELKIIANRVMENIETLKSALLNMYGNMATIHSDVLEIEKIKYGSRQWIGDIKWDPSMNKTESVDIVSDKLKNGETLPIILKLSTAGFMGSNKKYKDIDLGIDMMTANKEQVIAAVNKHKIEIRNFL